MDFDLDGNSALVTASSSGLGFASAQALAEEGANVAICGRDAERLDAAREDLEAAGTGDVLAVQTDLTDPDDVSRLVGETVDAFGGLDHLVTSSGGPPSTTFRETDEQDWYQAYDLLVMSVVWTLEEAYEPLLESEYGSITCITSRTVREVADGLLLSNSVRRGVIGLVKTISREFAPEIRANAVLPGTIETPRIEELIEAGVERGTYDDYEEGLAAMADDIPADRIGDPRELGDVVAFLSSPRASFVNGAEVPIDGGLLRS
ncbi:SDR family oxidoreductase [Natrinema thermotolerans]|uniref:SDR family oxidoreductase n=1 Tax=Natrinema thermotolerans TaxID=121872 RepID=A0AAF0PCD7_9EURY|nr:SDR family oxidoreductase [Natrinema thermotolerans]QCC59175.1 SDR family oxidoreductase [Natrinema thermotolerans]WMT06133.1 SDR family oxidoreductase [Natrinema thermotolerans]